MDEYRLTVGLWARGILREYHGVRPEECEWFTSAPERAGYQPPAGVNITVVDEPTEALLLRGEIDALIPPNIVPSFRAKDPRIRRVFKDPRTTVNEYFRKTQNLSDHPYSCRPAIAYSTNIPGWSQAS